MHFRSKNTENKTTGMINIFYVIYKFGNFYLTYYIILKAYAFTFYILNFRL